MTQSNAMTLAADQMADAPPSPGPKLEQVLRKHKWLIIIGTLIGVLIAVGLFLAFRKYDPLYEAKVEFRVIPHPRNPLTSGQRQLIGTSSSGVALLMNSEINFIRSPQFLEKVIMLPAFQNSTWLAANKSDPAGKLRKQLQLSPIPHSYNFVMAFLWHNPAEARTLVNAIATLYIQQIHNNEVQRLSGDSSAVHQDERKLEQQVADLEANVETYRIANDIPGLIERRTVLATTLTDLNALKIHAEIAAQQARQDYLSLKKQAAENTLTLSPKMQITVDENPTLLNLTSSLLEVRQSIAVSTKSYGQNFGGTRALLIRKASIERQIQREKNRLTARAKVEMIEEARNKMLSAEAMALDAVKRLKLLAQVTKQLSLLNLDRASDMVHVRLSSLAVKPKRRAFPLISHFLIVGIIAALVLSLGLAYLVEITNTKVNTPRDITGIMRLPLLGFIPDHADDPMLSGNPMTSVRTSPSSMTAESFRQIRGRLAACVTNKPLQTVLVASFSPGGGATTVASNLAIGIALSELRVLLVDANFYRPNLRTIYKNIPEVGLTDVLAGHATLEDAVVQSQDLPTLFLIGGGSRERVPTELTEHRSFPELLEKLKSSYDMVIFDGAPLTFVSDSINLAARVDGVIAVLRAGMITRGTVTRIREQLRSVHANLLGLVLNATQAFSSGYFRQNYRAFFQYASSAKESRPRLTGK
jgi:protein-tyrosine kinase